MKVLALAYLRRTRKLEELRIRSHWRSEEWVVILEIKSEHTLKEICPRQTSLEEKMAREVAAF